MSGSQEPGPAEQRPVTVRPVRPVRYSAFILSGVIVGVVGAFVVWSLGTADGQYSPAAVLGYLAMLGAIVGGLFGGVVAVTVEAVQRRRATGGR